MAHNIMENKRMFFVGEKPWHGLGTELNEPATAVEAIKAADLDYTVVKEKVFAIHNGSNVLVPGKFATINLANNLPLGIVGDNYKVIQNREAFSFFDVVVGEGQAIYQTAGALGKGERIWVLAKLPKEMVIAREDIVEKYLVLTNSHDGTSSLKMYFTPIRVVCQNTLNASLKDTGDGISIRHIGNVKSKIDEARRVLGIAVNYFSQFELISKQLVDVKLDVKKAESYFERILKIDGDDEASTRKENQKLDLLHLFEYGKGNDNPAVRHTMWAGYNAVTEYTDHYKAFRNEEEDKTNRLSSIWFGSAARLKGRAFSAALEIAGIKN